MALKYFCNNKKCSSYKKEIEESRCRYVFRDGKMIPLNIPHCKECGVQMSYIDEKNDELPRFKIGEFNGMSDSDKKSVLIKRHREHSNSKAVQEKMKFHKDNTLKRFFGK